MFTAIANMLVNTNLWGVRRNSKEWNLFKAEEEEGEEQVMEEKVIEKESDWITSGSFERLMTFKMDWLPH